MVIDDAMTWLREPHPGVVPPGGFDAVIVDLPDPDNPVLGRLYSAEFYTLITHALAPHGLMVVQSGSPYSTPTVFWRTVSTIRAAGFAVTPYHVDVPTFGDWGFTLAAAARPRRSHGAERCSAAEVSEPAGARRRDGLRQRRGAAAVGSRRRWSTRAS